MNAIHWVHDPQGERPNREAIELSLETLPSEERDHPLSREILTTTVEVNA